jgi:hypothetical protein
MAFSSTASLTFVAQRERRRFVKVYGPGFRTDSQSASADHVAGGRMARVQVHALAAG